MGTAPTWTESKSFFLFGLFGEHHVNVDQICGEGGVAQMQSVDTFSNVLLQFITLGIYFPRTAKVWCNQ